jgi:hypothetical protein
MSRIVGWLSVLFGLVVKAYTDSVFRENWRIGLWISAFFVVVGAALLSKTINNDFKMLARHTGRWLRWLFYRR